MSGQKWNPQGVYTGVCCSSQLRRTKCLGNLLLPGVPYHPTAKALFPYRLLQMLYTTDHTPSCLAGKKTAKQYHSIAVTLMSLRGHLGEGGGGGRRRQLTLLLWPQVLVLEGLSGLILTPCPSLHSPCWGVGMFQAFADSSFISNDS